MLWKINWHNDLFTNGKNLHGKKSHRMILRSSFPRIHYYHNKWLQVKESQYLIPFNWTYSVVTISHFQWTAPNTWLINCMDLNTWLQLPTRESGWLQISSVHHTMKIEKFLGYKTLQCTNTATSSQERWTRANLSPITIFMNKLCSTLVQLVSPFTALKIIILYV